MNSLWNLGTFIRKCAANWNSCLSADGCSLLSVIEMKSKWAGQFLNWPFSVKIQFEPLIYEWPLGNLTKSKSENVQLQTPHVVLLGTTFRNTEPFSVPFDNFSRISPDFSSFSRISLLFARFCRVRCSPTIQQSQKSQKSQKIWENLRKSQKISKISKISENLIKS